MTRSKLLEKYRDINVDYDWWAYTYGDFKTQQLATNGICVDEMYFSGFWSQGDGACFGGYVDNWPLFLTVTGNEALIPIQERIEERLSLTCKHTGRHSHEYSTSFDCELEMTNPFDEEDEPLRHTAWGIETDGGECFINLLDDFIEFFRSQMRALYSQLEEEHDYLTDDERVVETLIANDMLDHIEEDIEDETY